MSDMSSADRPAAYHGRIRPDTRAIVLHGRPKNTGVVREIPLRQCSHDAPAARSGDPQTDVFADGDCLPDPGIFDRCQLVTGRSHHDVRSKSRQLETPLWIKAPKASECRGREQVDSRAVEERAGGQVEIGDRFAVIETFDVRPVFFRLRRHLLRGT